MKQSLTAIISLIAGLVLGWTGYHFLQQKTVISPMGQVDTNLVEQLEFYRLDRLNQYQPQGSQISLGEILYQTETFTAYQIEFTTLNGKKVSGQYNLPHSAESEPVPIIIMLRGFVPRELYTTGLGTRPAANHFASNGFATLAPDFLGYGQSDPEDENGFIARFQRPVTVLDLLSGLDSLTNVDTDHIFLWGHSNGGQIALSVLEITQQNYPTTLWAPVTKGFPYNILYFTDEYEDQGKALRASLADLEELTQAEYYSIDQYLDQIQAPLQLHQGMRDDAVPFQWSQAFESILDEKTDLEINTWYYPEADHNLRPDWDTVVARDLEFFREHLP